MLKHFHRHEATIHLTVLTTGASGVEAVYSVSTDEEKGALCERK